MTPGAPGSPMDQRFCHDITQISQSLERIAAALEQPPERPIYPPGVAEQLTEELFGSTETTVDRDLTLQWKLDVLNNRTVLGFTDWAVWHNQEQIEQAGEAIAAVRRGFADMEAQVKEEGTE